MNGLKVLVITQKIDAEDSLLGFFCTWLNELAKRINKIYVLALEKKNANLAKNIEVYSLGKENGNHRLKRFIRFNQVLLSLCLNKKIDLIFIHMCPEYAILAWPYAKLKNIPIVMWYAHGNTNLNLKIAHLLVNKVVTSSKDGFRLKSNKVVIAGQGIDIEKFSPLISGIPQNAEKIQDNRMKVILSVGRISPIKNYETLIEAANILINQKDIRDLKFQIVGGVPIKSQNGYLHFLKNTVSKYKLQDYVQFVGPVPYTQIQNYYDYCGLFINTSNTGSLDKAVLEAMACGKVVLTCNEAFKDILGIYSERLMFKKKNAIKLAERINSVFQMEEKPKDQLVQNLRNIVVQKHSLNRLIDRFRGVFYELI